MIRTLFREEFIRSMLKVLLGAALGALLSLVMQKAFEWMATPQEAQSAIEAISVFCILVFAAGCGSDIFSRRFREGPLRLLEVLPIGRAWIWLIRVSAAFATAGMVSAALVLAQPTLIEYPQHSVLAVAGFAFLLFATGCCVSTITRLPHSATTVLTGAVALGILSVFIAAQVYALQGFQLFQYPLSLVSAQTPLGLPSDPLEGPLTGPTMGIILPPFFLLFSLAVFVRGELDTRRRQWRNALRGSVLLVATLLISISALDADAFERGSTWRTSDLFQVSEDGAYVSAIQFKPGWYSPAFRVAIIETSTGNVLKTYEGRSWAGHLWTEDGAFIVFERDSTLRYFFRLGAESVNALRVFPSQRRLFRKTGYRLAASTADPRGPLLLMQETPPLAAPPSRYTLLRMDTAGGTKELLRIPVRGFSAAGLERAPDGTVLSMLHGGAWHVREDVAEITGRLGHFRFLSNEARQRAAASLASGDLPAGPRELPGKYLRTDRTLAFNESIWLYYIQADPKTRRGSLWARRNSTTEWKEVLKDLPLSDFHIKDLSLKSPEPFTRQWYPDIGALTGNGIVTWIDSTAARPTLTLFDLNSGERFDMGDVGIPGKGTIFATLIPLWNSSTLITVARNNLGVRSYLPGGFYYESGRGAPIRWTEPENPSGTILFVDKGGGYIYQLGSWDRGFQIFYAKPPAKPRLLSLP